MATGKWAIVASTSGMPGGVELIHLTCAVGGDFPVGMPEALDRPMRVAHKLALGYQFSVEYGNVPEGHAPTATCFRCKNVIEM